MLLNIDPLLAGELLAWLDQMGHTDAVVIADAHFPAARLGRKVIDLPGISSPRAVRAVRSVLPPDDYPRDDGRHGFALMQSPDGVLPIQRELMAAAQLDEGNTDLVDRYAFYDLAAQAEVIIRTGETRIFGNALLRKGIVPGEVQA